MGCQSNGTVRASQPIRPGRRGEPLPPAVDNPDAGWNGRGVWAAWRRPAPFHAEIGAGTPSEVVHFQLGPDALAKYLDKIRVDAASPAASTRRRSRRFVVVVVTRRPARAAR